MKRRPLRTYLVTASVFGLMAATVQIASCTVFNGLEVATETVDGGKLFETGPGEGGDATPVDPCLGSNDGYLSLTEAARACSWMFKCPILELNLESSLGLIGSDTNFALCMNWLAGPVPPTRVGRDIQQASLKCIARATTCEEASSCLAVEGFFSDDPRCDAGADSAFLLPDHCEGTSGIDCTDGVAFHCAAASYGGTAQCLIDEGGIIGCGQFDPAGTCPFRVTSCDPVTGNFNDCAQDTQIDVSFSCQAVGSVCGDAGPEAGHKFDCLTNGTYEEIQRRALREQVRRRHRGDVQRQRHGLTARLRRHRPSLLAGRRKAPLHHEHRSVQPVFARPKPVQRQHHLDVHRREESSVRLRVRRDDLRYR